MSESATQGHCKALAFFVPRSAALRRQGILEYGTLGQIHSIDFHEKWIRQRAGHEAEFLAAPESSTLADYGRSYTRLEQLKPFPTDRGTFIALGLSLVLPMLPAILAVIPLAVVLKSLPRHCANSGVPYWKLPGSSPRSRGAQPLVGTRSARDSANYST